MPQNPKSNSAISKFQAKWDQKKFVSVGLDSEVDKLPKSIKGQTAEDKLFSFNRAIVDTTYDLVNCYKPNSAFYEAEGEMGIEILRKTCEYINEKDSSIPILIDSKRGDIGNTNRGYTKFVFDILGADATTVQPYQGGSILEEGERKLEALLPFLEEKDKLIFILCRTSNPSSGEFQDLPISLKDLSQEYKAKFGDLSELRDILEVDVIPLYLVVAYIISRNWNIYGNLGLVVGATYPNEMIMIRKIVPDLPILMPGSGSQGGDTEKSVKFGLNTRGQGLIVNSSRGIIYASNGEDFAKAARDETVKLQEEIIKYC